MKTLLVILLFYLSSLTKGLIDEQTNLLKKWHMECFNETHVDPQKILALKAGNWQIHDKPLKIWVLCLLRKFDLMTNEGVFKLDTALSMVPARDRSDVEDFIDECLPRTRRRSQAPYDIAWEYTKCYHLKSKQRKHRDKKLHYLVLFY